MHVFVFVSVMGSCTMKSLLVPTLRVDRDYDGMTICHKSRKGTSFSRKVLIFESKPTIRHIRPAKTQISLRIRAVLSEYSLISCAFYSFQDIQRGIKETLEILDGYTSWSVFAGHTGLIVGFVVLWASARQNQQSSICTQRRLKSAWASAQSDQSLCCALKG